MDTSIVYRMAVERHQEQVARGEATERLDNLLAHPSARERIAAALITLARRLAPIAPPVQPETPTLAPATPA